MRTRIRQATDTYVFHNRGNVTVEKTYLEIMEGLDENGCGRVTHMELTDAKVYGDVDEDEAEQTRQWVLSGARLPCPAYIQREVDAANYCIPPHD